MKLALVALRPDRHAGEGADGEDQRGGDVVPSGVVRPALHYVGVLKLKRATAETEGGVAWALAEEGEQILRGQIHTRPEDPYPAAALVDHKLRFLLAHGGQKFDSEVRDL